MLADVLTVLSFFLLSSVCLSTVCLQTPRSAHLSTGCCIRI